MNIADIPYNRIPYPSAIYPQTHPDRLASAARLLGLQPAPLENCRVLELGCGDGMNLISMAHALPNATFTGIDLAEEPIRRGQRIVQTLGLPNVDLRIGDICQVGLGPRQFDYIIAHGLYSWVPAAVRDRILQICRDHLAPNGIAYVSYNAYPGNHLRDLSRGMMQFHARNLPDPLDQVHQGRALLKLVAEAGPESSAFRQAARHEFERVAKYNDAAFYHDDFSPENRPVYFWQFAEHAASFALQYLAEAEFTAMQALNIPDQVVTALEAFAPGNIVAREQYLDFFKGRAFRQTLICHAGIPIDRTRKPERLFDLRVAGDIRSTGTTNGEMADFTAPNGMVIATSNPLAKSALQRLGHEWPRRIPFADLVPESISSQERIDLADFFLRCHEIGFLDLHVWTPDFVTSLSARPHASRVARFQATIGPVLPTPRHTVVKLDGPIAQKLVTLLDGSRDHDALLSELFHDEPSLTRESLDAMLQAVARMGLLAG